MKIWVITLLIFLTLGICVWVIDQADVPVVFWSHSKDECVKIIIKGSECDCSVVPEKYTRVWVK
jgi:hypothetical protein